MVYLGRSDVVFLDKVERLQFSESSEQLDNLLVVQVQRETSNENLVFAVRNICRNNSWNMDLRNLLDCSLWGLIIFRATNLKRLGLENNTIKCHRSSGLLRRAELNTFENNNRQLVSQRK